MNCNENELTGANLICTNELCLKLLNMYGMQQANQVQKMHWALSEIFIY